VTDDDKIIKVMMIPPPPSKLDKIIGFVGVVATIVYILTDRPRKRHD
jgi:hypothetical protein